MSAYIAAGWTVIVAALLVYLLLTTQQPFEQTWEQNREEFLLYVLIGIIASYAIPLLSWKRVVLDTDNKELQVQKAVDKLTGRMRIYSLAEIVSVEKKYNFMSRARILFITLRSGKVIKLNINFLADCSKLDEQLLQLNNSQGGGTQT